MATSTKGTDVLPSDVLSHILDYLPHTLPVLLIIEQISKQFYTVADAHWKIVWDNTYSTELKRNHRHACIQMRASKKSQHKSTKHEVSTIVLGAGGVGKSTLTLRFIQNVFIEEYDPTMYVSISTSNNTSEDTYRKQIERDGEKVMISILDTAGQSEYCVLRATTQVKNTQGVLLVCTLQDRNSLHEMENDLKLYAQIQKKEPSEINVVIAVNKCDLGGAVCTIDEVHEFANKYQIKSAFETSAKDDINVTEAFLALVARIHRKVEVDPKLVAKLENGERIISKKDKCMIM